MRISERQAVKAVSVSVRWRLKIWAHLEVDTPRCIRWARFGDRGRKNEG